MPTIGSKSTCTAEHHASKVAQMVRLLIQHRAGLWNHADLAQSRMLFSQSGNTVLRYAACRSCAESVKALLEAGAAIDLQDNDGSTPLFSAASELHLEIVSQLLAAGTDPNLRIKAPQLQHSACFSKRNGIVCKIDIDPRSMKSHVGKRTHRRLHTWRGS